MLKKQYHWFILTKRAFKAQCGFPQKSELHLLRPLDAGFRYCSYLDHHRGCWARRRRLGGLPLLVAIIIIIIIM